MFTVYGFYIISAGFDIPTKYHSQSHSHINLGSFATNSLSIF